MWPAKTLDMKSAVLLMHTSNFVVWGSGRLEQTGPRLKVQTIQTAHPWKLSQRTVWYCLWVQKSGLLRWAVPVTCLAEVTNRMRDNLPLRCTQKGNYNDTHHYHSEWHAACTRRQMTYKNIWLALIRSFHTEHQKRWGLLWMIDICRIGNKVCG